MLTVKTKKKAIRIIKELRHGSKVEFTTEFWEKHGMYLSVGEARALGRFIHKQLYPQYLDYNFEGAVYENKKSNNMRQYIVK